MLLTRFKTKVMCPFHYDVAYELVTVTHEVDTFIYTL